MDNGIYLQMELQTKVSVAKGTSTFMYDSMNTIMFLCSNLNHLMFSRR